MDGSQLRPMLAVAGNLDKLSTGPWSYEFKWDGARAIVQHTADGIRAWSRRGGDFTESFPELAGLAEILPPGAILDGEICAFDAQRRPSFQVLQRRLNVRNAARVREAMARTPIALMAFDLLHDGRSSLLEAPYTVRRQALVDLQMAGPHWQVPAAQDDLTTVLQVVGDLGLEGIVAKRPASTYRPGERSDAWAKLRIKLEQEFVVGGHRPGKGSRLGLGSLLLGVHDEAGELVFCGSVGSGLTDAEVQFLQQHLQERRRETSPFVNDVPHDDAIFSTPDLVVQVRFAEWTTDGLLRQPTYRGRRADKDPAEVVREG